MAKKTLTDWTTFQVRREAKRIAEDAQLRFMTKYKVGFSEITQHEFVSLLVQVGADNLDAVAKLFKAKPRGRDGEK